jgi:hypothetical protein
VRQAITVNATFDAYSEQAQVEIRDPTGKLLSSAMTPIIQATRMRVEAIQ